MRISRLASLPSILLSSFLLAPLTPAVAKDAELAKAIAASHRSADFVKRDAARKPQEELEFFGIKPDLTVVEIAPGGGYWTEILAPYLRDKGAYYIAIAPASASPQAKTQVENWQKKIDGNKAIYGNTKISELGRTAFNIAPPGSADMVLTFRNVHNWMGADTADKVFAEFYRALKPGGILGVEEHRGSNDKPQDPKAASGYVREDYTIALAEKAGFKLLGKSEILANPKDTKDYPEGVWALPPVLTLGEKDRAKYVAIGEADNFVLKFQKPK